MITHIPAPRINTNDDKVEVAVWHVNSGDYLEEGQEVVDLETSKAIVTVNSERAGFFCPLVEKRTVIKVGAPLYLLADSAEELSVTSSEKPNPTVQPLDTTTASRPTLDSPKTGGFKSSRFSRAALQWIRDNGLTEADFNGAGLVTARSLSKPTLVSAETPRAAVDVPAGPATCRIETVSLAKQAEIQALSIGENGNINSTLSVYFKSAPIRARLLQEQAFDGSIQPLVLYEIARLLAQWPQFTAYFAEGAIHYYDCVDLGIAFDLGKGLKVVTLPQADKLLPVDFYEKTIEIGIRYLENRIRPDELLGSTLTVTDLSGFNVLHFHPLINGQQAAIIGLGGDSHQPGHPMSINMTFDHRVSNGREVATFLDELRGRLLSYASQEDAYLPGEEASLSGEDILQIQATTSIESLVVDPTNTYCDLCGIDLVTYYRDFSKDAFMVPYFREDGSLGKACHRCFGGWV